MRDEVCQQDVELPLPKNWPARVRHAVLNVIGLVRIAMLVGRESLIKNGDIHEARIHQLESEVAMLREELRINGARMQRVVPHRRPQYTTVQRMAILQLRAMRGWSKAETARRFFLTDDTVRAWLQRADDDLLVQTRTPVNRFPNFVRYAILRHAAPPVCADRRIGASPVRLLGRLSRTSRSLRGNSGSDAPPICVYRHSRRRPVDLFTPAD